MIVDSYAFEDADPFVVERPAGNAVEMQDARMRREARENRRIGVLLRPFQHSGEAGPVRLGFQIVGSRLGPRDDQAVVLTLPKLVDARIPAYLTLSEFAPRNLRERVQSEVDRNVIRGGAEQRPKLPLRGIERCIG